MNGMLRRVAGVTLIAAVALIAGCSDDSPTDPTTGSLELLLLMDGTDIDPNGGLLLIDGESMGTIAEDIEVSIEDLEVGVYVVEVRGIDANCEILGNNPRNVRIRGGITVSEEFLFLSLAQLLEPCQLLWPLQLPLGLLCQRQIVCCVPSLDGDRFSACL